MTAQVRRYHHFFKNRDNFSVADVIVEPGRPIGPLLVSDVTNTSVTLSWNPPEYLGGGSLTCYIIEARLITCADIIK